MSPINNDIVNANVNLKNNNNYIDNDKYSRARQVELIADLLLQKFEAKSESRPFMCKVAWKLSEARIWGNAEQALQGKKINNPMGLFIYLCKRDGV